MSKKVTINQFVEKVQRKHGKYTYDYSKFIYNRAKVKSVVICKKHGEFLVCPSNHYNGKGCPICANERVAIFNSSNTEEFIEKAKIIHGDKYDYSDTNYIKNSIKVKINCPVHGQFEQTPMGHLKGGCKKCGRDSTKLTNEQYINKANKIHNFKFDYSILKYIDSKTNIEFICPEHGIMSSRPDVHLTGTGCKQCGIDINIKTRTRTTKEVIRTFKEIHGNRYNYDELIYITSNSKVKIYCTKCKNFFWQTPSSHGMGKGCLKCAKDVSLGFKRTDFINKYKNKLCILYIVNLFNKTESFIKIGITGQTLKKRFCNIPYNFDVMKSFQYSPDKVWDLEKRLHKQLKEFKYKPLIKFGGETECFEITAYNNIILLCQN